MEAGRHLGCVPTGSRAIRSADRENPTLKPDTKRSDNPLQRYGDLKFPRWRPAAIFDLEVN